MIRSSTLPTLRALLLLAATLTGCRSAGAPSDGRGGDSETGGPPGVVLPGPAARIDAMTVVFDGDCFAVIWSSLPANTSSRSLYLARLKSDGSLTLPPTRIVSLDYAPSLLQLVPVGQGYVLWYFQNGNNHAGTVWALRLGRDGSAPAGPKSIVSTESVGYDKGFGLAWNGKSFGLLVERRDQTSSLHRVELGLFTAELVPVGTFTTVTSSAEEQSLPALAWLDTAGFVAAWWEGEKIRAAGLSIDSGALVRGPLTLASSPTLKGLRLTPDDQGRLLASWSPVRPSAPVSLLVESTLAFAWPEAHRLIRDDNRLEDMSYALAARKGTVTVAWSSDVERSLPQIYLGHLDLTRELPPAATSQAVTRPPGAHGRPRLASSPEGTVLLHTAEVDGGDQLSFRWLQH